MLRWKSLIVFILAVAISGIAASYRWGDSAHAIGMLGTKGGKARHPFMIKSGKAKYTLVMTGVVLPPYKGDVKIALEGSPTMNYKIYASKPIFDLGIYRHPDLVENVLKNVESKDKLALWVVMTRETEEDLEALFDETPISAPELADTPLRSDSCLTPGQPLKLSFYATDSGKTLLQIPVLFADLQPGGGSHGAHH